MAAAGEGFPLAAACGVGGGLLFGGSARGGGVDLGFLGVVGEPSCMRVLV